MTGPCASEAIPVSSLWAEYVWLREHRPEWVVVAHRVVYEGHHPFDVLTIQSEEGERQDVCFTGCYAGSPPMPACPYCGKPLRTPTARQCQWCFADSHDPANVVYRKGREFVERVRSQHFARQQSEMGRLELRDPCAAFIVHFRPLRVSPEIVVLSFPEHLDEDERLFTIAVESLKAEGCRGAVYDVAHSQLDVGSGHAKPLTEEEGRLLGGVVLRLTIAARRGIRVVLLHGDHVIGFWQRSGPFALPPENYDTEEAAVAALKASLRDT